MGKKLVAVDGFFTIQQFLKKNGLDLDQITNSSDFKLEALSWSNMGVFNNIPNAQESRLPLSSFDFRKYVFNTYAGRNDVLMLCMRMTEGACLEDIRNENILAITGGPMLFSSTKESLSSDSCNLILYVKISDWSGYLPSITDSFEWCTLLANDNFRNALSDLILKFNNINC